MQAQVQWTAFIGFAFAIEFELVPELPIIEPHQKIALRWIETP